MSHATPSSTNSDELDPHLKYSYDSSDPALHQNPFPYFKSLLAAPPVSITRRGIQWAVISRYHEVQAALRDHRRFSSVNPGLPGTEDFDFFNGVPVMNFVDPPVHSRLRRVAAPSLAVRRMNEMEPRFRAIFADILHCCDERSEIDIVGDLGVELPVRVFGLLLDVPHADYEIIRSLGIGGSDRTEEFVASRAAYVADLVERRRHSGGGQDLIGLAIAAHDAGEKIDSRELFGMVMVLVTGAIATTADVISSAIYHLLLRPELLAQVRREPALVPAVVEETLRFDGPIHTIMRATTEDVEIGGMAIKARTPVYLVLGAANRDPAAFNDPDVFDITRDPNDHLGFGEGVHFCVGAAPARVQARIAIEMTLQRYPRMRLADGWRPSYRGTAFDRGLTHLPVRVD
ncbi:MAG TPA: cytochrome P450 [Candidatus Binataceae bacterium]|nr:cytochrome P450 [Candidatus Binataceae bacterium]